MSHTYLIVDDEPLAHELIEGFCQTIPHLTLAKHCYNALEAMEYLSNHSVDFMFLDLNMPKLKGFDFLKTLHKPPKVIVTTAYQEFALEGYELGVVDYLLKPFSFERLLKAVNKAIVPLPSSGPPVTSTATNSLSFFIKGDKKYHQVNSKDILFVEAYGNYSKVYLEDMMLLSHEGISAMEDLLPVEAFIRVHKSFLVSVDKIETIEGNRIFMKEHKIPIGQTYKSMVNRVLLG